MGPCQGVAIICRKLSAFLTAVVVALIAAAGSIAAVVASHMAAGRKLEVIRLDVNSNLTAALNRVDELADLLERHGIETPAPPPAKSP